MCMRVNNIQTYNTFLVTNTNNYKKSQLNFGAYYDSSREIKSNVGDDVLFRHSRIHNYSCLFRSPKLFTQLPKIIQERYPNGVKIYDYGCSAGYEPVSLLLSMHNSISDSEIDKYLPMEAIDNNKDAIKLAKKYSLKLDTEERFFLNNNLNNINKSEYLKLGKTLPDGQKVCICTKKVKNEIQYQIGDLYKDLCNNKFKGKPCVLLFRNAWQFMTKEGAMEFANKLYEKLPKNSMLIIGGMDIAYANANKLLTEQGFKPLENKINKDSLYYEDIPETYCFIR